MTPAELRALAEVAKGYMDRGYLVENDECLAAQETLRELAPDLARLCAEMGETLERYVDQPVGTRFHDPDEAFAVLAKLSELAVRM